MSPRIICHSGDSHISLLSAPRSCSALDPAQQPGRCFKTEIRLHTSVFRALHGFSFPSGKKPTFLRWFMKPLVTKSLLPVTSCLCIPLLSPGSSHTCQLRLEHRVPTHHRSDLASSLSSSPPSERLPGEPAPCPPRPAAAPLILPKLPVALMAWHLLLCFA